MSTITLTLTATSLTVSDAPATVTASVTNSSSVPARVVLGAFAPLADSPSPAGAATPAAATAWTSVERPLRELGPGATEQYTVTLAPPAATAAGEYGVRLIAYDADRPPEEYGDQAQQVSVTVTRQAPPAAAGIPWWIYAIAGALVLVVAVVAFLVLRPGPPEPTLSPSPSPTPTVNACPEPFVPRNSRPGDNTCVMPASAEEAQWDNRDDVQRRRVIPGTTECQIPYVPRVAFPDDLVCVWEDTANRTHIENQPGYTEYQFNEKEYPKVFTPRR